MDLTKIYETYMDSNGDLQKYQYDYYHNKQDTVPVYQRKPASPLKAATHTNLHVNFFEDIIQRKIGYMASKIKIKIEDEKIMDLIDEFNNNTKQKTKNIESITNTSISGISHRLIYTQDGEVYIKNIPGWQVVYNYKDDVFNATEAYYYYTTTSLTGEKINHCDIYTMTTVKYYEKIANTTMDYEMVGDEQPHNFNKVPIFPFINNPDMNGDCHDALAIMDIYDELISDTSAELKAARLAYLKIYGDLYTGQDAEGNAIPIPDYLREFGTMLFGTDELGNNLGDAQFLEKNIDDVAISNMLNRLRSHIFEISSSVDLKELTANNDLRVFSIQANISRLENNSAITEQFVKMALKRQYDLYFYWLGEYRGLHYDISDLEFIFERVFTKDIEALVRTANMAVNIMSVEDAYNLTGLFDKPEEAVERYNKEKGIMPDDDFGTNK